MMQQEPEPAERADESAAAETTATATATNAAAAAAAAAAEDAAAAEKAEEAGDEEGQDAGLSARTAAEKGLPWRNVAPKEAFALERGGDLVISQGSVVGFDGDAIVNAANTRCLGGGGVDGAISNAGGRSLFDARVALPVIEDTESRCATGDAVITIGGDLNASYCIHAVGPMYMAFDSLEEADEVLRSAYQAAMARAEEKSLRTIAFSLLSAGVFRGDQTLDRVIEIGVEAIRDAAYPGLEEVHLCAFLDDELATAIQAAETVFYPPESNSDDDAGSESGAGGIEASS